MKEEDRNKIIQQLAAALPQNVIEEFVSASLRQTLENLRWADRELVELVNKAVISRAEELLKTKYKEELEKKAEYLAANVVQMMGKLVLQEKHRY